jgi:hypothetical protein
MMSSFILLTMSASRSVKIIIPVLCLLFFAMHVTAQVVNQVQIIPSNPSAADSIYAVTDFSYYGNCSFGLVYNYVWVTDSTIHAMPTYCGYGDSTLCNSIDTLSLGVYPSGNYIVSIEFHQGSICPASGFDATLAYFDTVLTVGPAAGINGNHAVFSDLRVYPNPASESISLEGSFSSGASRLTIFNVLGKSVLSIDKVLPEISIADLEGGVYSLFFEQNGKILTTTFIKL